MSQVTGNPNLKYGGMYLAAGSAANLTGVLLWGTPDPNTINDTSLDRATTLNADVGCLYVRFGVGIYQKTALPNTWQQVTVP